MFFVSLFKPRLNFWTKKKSRQHSLIYLATALVFFILIGVTAPPSQDEYVQNEKTMADSAHKSTDISQNNDKVDNQDSGLTLSNSSDSTDTTSSNDTSTNSETNSTTTTDASSSGSSTSSSAAGLTAAVVSRNVDGDTIHVIMNGKDDTIRMLLIDTPEDQDPRKPVEPFSYKAADYAKSVLPVGKHIYLQLGKKGYQRDKYDRLLAYVYITPSDMYNEDVVKKGLARVAYIYPPNTDHLSDLQSDQYYAKSHKLGIWSLTGFANSDGYNLAISCNYAKNNGYSTRGCGTATATKPKTGTKKTPTTSTPTNVSGSSLNVLHGQIASVTITTKPGAKGTIEVIYKSGPSTAAGLEPKTADSSGKITWSWKVGSRTTPGNYDVNITVNGTSIHKTLTVR